MFGYANLDQGSFASHGIWKADYIFKIPDSITRDLAAPLMCGGGKSDFALQSSLLLAPHPLIASVLLVLAVLVISPFNSQQRRVVL